jgi:hypothetical protein
VVAILVAIGANCGTAEVILSAQLSKGYCLSIAKLGRCVKALLRRSRGSGRP